MSNKLQTLDSLKSVGQAVTAGPADGVMSEYEAGKKHLENKEYGPAAVALHNALVGYEEKNDEVGIANASNQLGHVCLARGEFENALNHYQRSFVICDKNNDRMSIIAVLNKKVEACLGLKNYAKATAACLDMLDIYHDNRDPQGTVVTLEKMAEIYLQTGDKRKAADTYRTISAVHKNFKHASMAASFLQKAEQEQ